MGVHASEEDDTTSLDNVKFYNNEMQSTPRGDFVDNIHKNWLGNHELLESHHGFVQWLFPLRESGMNFRCQPFSKHESSVFRTTPKIRERCVKSFELMLDFYGFVLSDKHTGQIKRNPSTFGVRIFELNHSYHNFLRITRILKWLGSIGLEHYKFRWLNSLILEVFGSKKLHNADQSCVRFWIPTCRRKEDIERLDGLVRSLGCKVNREGRDGWGDDPESWQTEYYPDELSEKLNLGEKDEHEDSFDIQKEPEEHDCDPFKGVREKFPVRSIRRRRFYYSSSSDDEDEEDEKKKKEKEGETEEEEKKDEDK